MMSFCEINVLHLCVESVLSGLFGGFILYAVTSYTETHADVS